MQFTRSIVADDLYRSRSGVQLSSTCTRFAGVASSLFALSTGAPPERNKVLARLRRPALIGDHTMLCRCRAGTLCVTGCCIWLHNVSVLGMCAVQDLVGNDASVVPENAATCVAARSPAPASTLSVRHMATFSPTLLVPQYPWAPRPNVCWRYSIFQAQICSELDVIVRFLLAVIFIQLRRRRIHLRENIESWTVCAAQALASSWQSDFSLDRLTRTSD